MNTNAISDGGNMFSPDLECISCADVGSYLFLENETVMEDLVCPLNLLLHSVFNREASGHLRT